MLGIALGPLEFLYSYVFTTVHSELHLMDNEMGAQKLDDLPTVTQLLSGRAVI